MLLKVNKLLPAFFFLSLGTVNLLSEYFDSQLIFTNSLYAVFILIGIIGVFFYTDHSKPLLFISSSLFMYGIYKILLNNFELLNKSSFSLPVLLLIVGISAFMLYFDNPSDIIFLYTALLLILLGITAFVFKGFWFVQFGNSLCEIVLTYWQVFIIFIGINLLLSNRKS